MTIRIVSLAILFIAGASFSTLEKDVNLEYTFKVGDQYEWLQTTSQTVKQTIPGMGDVSIDIKMEGAFDLKVLELTATGAKIEMRYARLKVESKSPLADVNFDSNGDVDNTQNKIVKSMVGKQFSFTMTKRGIIEKVEGSENLLSGLSELGLDEAAQARAKQMLNETVGENSVKASLGTGFLSYPDKKIKAGDHWKQSSVLPLSLPLTISNDWSLKAVDGPVATVQADGEFSTAEKEKITTLPNGIKSKVDLGGRQVLSGKVNVKTGWPTGIKVLSEIKGKMLLLAGGMIPADMEVPMEITTESVYTINKK
jgi:hypothetical protein